MVLLIDNYDSFTYNLYDYVAQVGKQIKVIRNDELTIEQIKILDFESIIISPGPERPENAGATNQIIKEFHATKPILGICLGHQAIGEFFGAKLEKALRPMHGKTSLISTQHHPIWKGLPKKFEVMRYHSLVLNHLPKEFKIIAESEDREVMAITHKTLPLMGIQFHPESILTKHGLQIMRNWFEHIK